MSKVKSPSMAAFKAQWRRPLVTTAQRSAAFARMAESGRKLRDAEEVEDAFVQQQKALTWFLYGWNAALKSKEPTP